MRSDRISNPRMRGWSRCPKKHTHFRHKWDRIAIAPKDSKHTSWWSIPLSTHRIRMSDTNHSANDLKNTSRDRRCCRVLPPTKNSRMRESDEWRRMTRIRMMIQWYYPMRKSSIPRTFPSVTISVHALPSSEHRLYTKAHLLVDRSVILLAVRNKFPQWKLILANYITHTIPSKPG